MTVPTAATRRPRQGRTPLHIGMSALSILVAVGLVVGLPYFVDVGWSDIGAQFAALDPAVVAGLVVLWLAGLWAYTFVLTASLPGLSRPQAMTLNAAGSAVSNLMPFGGAAGVALTFALARSWGFRTNAIAISTVTSGLWNVLARFLLPALGLLALIATGRVPDARVAVPALVAAVALIGLVSVTVTALRGDRAARVTGRGADRVLRLLPQRIRPRRFVPSVSLARLRTTTAGLLRTAWPTMTAGMVIYLVLQAALFCACLAATGAYVGLGEAVAAFALGRLLTTVVVTPGGFGISEAGTAAAMVSLGGPAGPVAAAVLLFSTFTYILEIPLGAVFWSLRGLVSPQPGAASRRDDTRPVRAGGH
jgi:putative heme transporter